MKKLTYSFGIGIKYNPSDIKKIPTKKNFTLDEMFGSHSNSKAFRFQPNPKNISNKDKKMK